MDTATDETAMKRKRAISIWGGMAASGLTALLITGVWTQTSTTSDLGITTETAVKGSDLVPWGVAVSLAAGATFLVLLALSNVLAIRIVSAVALVCSLAVTGAIAINVGAGEMAWGAFISAGAAAAAASMAIRYAPQWPLKIRSYGRTNTGGTNDTGRAAKAPKGPTPTAKDPQKNNKKKPGGSHSSGELWKALDKGEDPSSQTK